VGRRMSWRGEGRGFTLTEMMVVILLVGVLAVIAIPIYEKYIRQTKASEARSMIGAIVAAEKSYAERNGTFLAVPRGSYQEFSDKLRVDVRESDLFDYEVSSVSGKDTFTVTAWVNSQGVKEGLPASGYVRYVYNVSTSPRGVWTEHLE
jgi:prepilin-type N-terminal cleavage/methylation domain-containing protein